MDKDDHRGWLEGLIKDQHTQDAFATGVSKAFKAARVVPISKGSHRVRYIKLAATADSQGKTVEITLSHTMKVVKSTLAAMEDFGFRVGAEMWLALGKPPIDTPNTLVGTQIVQGRPSGSDKFEFYEVHYGLAFEVPPEVTSD